MCLTSLSRAGSSPHTRGALRAGVGAAHRPGIIPAYAGSTPGLPSPPRRMPDHPRIRGEHVAPPSTAGMQPGSSPHTRGARPRGFRSAPGPGSSPHTRGARLAGQCCDTSIRIIPAYAGSTRRRASRTNGMRDHPRIRGEHASPGTCRRRPTGSSPHTRGALPRLAAKLFKTRIIPAYAGSTGRSSSDPSSTTDHPRIRGEHAAHGPEIRGRRGSSPHTRGAPVAGDHKVVEQRIIPAYAGSTAEPGVGHGELRDHPRIRGEHTKTFSPPRAASGSSPHTRGAPVALGIFAAPVGIIPAYAGSTVE